MKLIGSIDFDDEQTIPTGVGPITISRFTPTLEKLAVRLFGTGYEFCELTVDSEVEETALNPISIVIHPTRGILAVDAVSERPETDFAAHLRDVQTRLDRRCELLKAWLRDDAWKKAPLPIAPVVIRRGISRDVDLSETNIDPEIVVDCTWHDVPARLGEIIDHHFGNNGFPDLYIVDELAAGFKARADGYLDHVDFLALSEVASAQLFSPDDYLNSA